MLLFELDREEDPSGVSGTGVVAKGTIFDDGSVAVRWPGSTTVWDSVEDMMNVHGHEGRTKLRVISPKGVPAAYHALDAMWREGHAIRRACHTGA